MGFLGRIFGICHTPLLADASAWRLDGSTLEVDLAKVPALADAGSAVRLEGGTLPVRVVLLHGVDGTWHAYENRCTHMGRRIDPVPGAAQLECCSVGKSTWDYEGRRVAGSATEELKVFPAEREGDTLRVELPS